jgi:hypothetical protein
MAFLNEKGLERLLSHLISLLNSKMDKMDVATDEDIIDLMLKMDMLPIIQDSDGTILIDSDNAIILI